MTEDGSELKDRFSSSVRANTTDILAYLARRTGQPAEAADVFGAVLAIAWEKATRMPQDAESSRMWLFVIARNVLLNHTRAIRRRARHETEQPAGEIASAIISLEEAIDVRDAVKRLAPKYRELVMLVHWDGFSLSDAAQLCGVGPSTARTRYARAREQLRAQLAIASESSRR